MCRTSENGRFRKKWTWLAATVLCLAMFLAAPGTAQAGQIYRVKAGAEGGNGLSWENACDSLAEVLASADVISGDQIWVAAGTYKPEFNNSYERPAADALRTKTFALKAGVAIYGGFAGGDENGNGGETSLDERNIVNNVTILTGDLDSNDIKGDLSSPDILSSREDNSYHVVYSENVTSTDVAVLDGFTITGGNADGDTVDNKRGGGMYNKQSSPTVTNCTFSGNYVKLHGGGMYNDNNSSPEVMDCTFSENRADYHGGGMYNINNSEPIVTSCTFSGNSTTYDGGGVYNDNSNPKVTNCTFSENSTDRSGGGMYNYNDSNPDVTNCTFEYNSASNNGGGMYSSNCASPDVTYCTFLSNEADLGGGMYNSNSSPQVTSCTFTGNSTDSSGGGMYNNDNSQPTVTYCTFSENSAHAGGGMCNKDSNPEVTNCMFSENTAYSDQSGSGGGMFNKEHSCPTVKDCTFRDNESVLGGGMNNHDSKPRVENCTFSGNKAKKANWGCGGGMCNESITDGSDLVVINCTFSENCADYHGGGMFNNDSDSMLINCTFNVNSSDCGGGMYNSGSKPTVTNCIFWDGHGGEICNKYSSIPTVSYCVVKDNEVGTGTVSSDIIADDPQLGSLADNGCQTTCGALGTQVTLQTCALLTGSPAIDAGTSESYHSPNDQRGVVRLSGQVDIGAYEFDTTQHHTLTIMTNGTGTGTISPDVGTHSYVYGTTVMLTATPAANSTFAGWAGDLSSSANPAAVTMDGDKTVTATFASGSHTLTVTTDGTGTGTVSPDVGTHTYADGRAVELTATPATNSTFTGWSGGLSGNANPATVTMDGDKTVTATFKKTTSGPEPTPPPTPTPTPEPTPPPVTDDIPVIPDASPVLDALTADAAGLGLDLPDELSGTGFKKVESSDVKNESLVPAQVVSEDVQDVLDDEVPEGTFITGISFDIEAGASSDIDGVGILPLDVTLDIPRAKLTPALLEVMEENGEGADLEFAFLDGVRVFKVIGDNAYDLFITALEADKNPEDFFSVSRDVSGDFHVSFGLLIVDAPACGKLPVQAAATSGDCRFLVLDGKTDGHFTDPLAAVESSRESGKPGGGGGCSIGALLPGVALLLVPLMLLRTRW